MGLKKYFSRKREHVGERISSRLTERSQKKQVRRVAEMAAFDKRAAELKTERIQKAIRKSERKGREKAEGFRVARKVARGAVVAGKGIGMVAQAGARGFEQYGKGYDRRQRASGGIMRAVGHDFNLPDKPVRVPSRRRTTRKRPVRRRAPQRRRAPRPKRPVRKLFNPEDFI